VNLGIFAHIDAGKTCLTERLLFDNGVIAELGSVLDGAALVLSAVEGVQAQTRVLMKSLRKPGLPTLIFVNKIDRRGARDGGLLTDIRQKLAPNALAMSTVQDAGTPAVSPGRTRNTAGSSPTVASTGRRLSRAVDLNIIRRIDHPEGEFADPGPRSAPVAEDGRCRLASGRTPVVSPAWVAQSRMWQE